MYIHLMCLWHIATKFVENLPQLWHNKPQFLTKRQFLVFNW
jgi:hypothetical protein